MGLPFGSGFGLLKTTWTSECRFVSPGLTSAKIELMGPASVVKFGATVPV
jgi:hypothetical protein